MVFWLLGYINLMHGKEKHFMKNAGVRIGTVLPVESHVFDEKMIYKRIPSSFRFE